MAILLAAPKTIRQGKFTAQANAAQFQMLALNGEPTPMRTNEVFGILEGAVFTPTPGIDAATEQQADVTVGWTQAEYDAFAARPEVQTALGMAKQGHDYLASGRDPAKKPVWFP